MRLNENGKIFYRYVQTSLTALDCGVLTLTQANHPSLKIATVSYTHLSAVHLQLGNQGQTG